MISPQLIALSLLAVVSASPLDARATCSPNFEGAGIAVGAPGGFVFPGGLNRGHSAFVPAWHIQQTGQPNGGYIFKDIWNNNIALTRNSDNTVTVAPASDSGTDRNQQFQITCQSCSGGASTAPPMTLIASTCNIRWIGDTSLCLQVPDRMFLSPCDNISGFGPFSFST
ncbi:hypothetical protein Moror_7562 [Moniliophthora roreri MCA 2997]|uniref:Uncharacterized protein n=1 Tax=Moniliophthora roreri (strain MCA 2997) TaxID=1381753 RepID=V2WQN0_MONRO|nr:hypothetical protein Moror_7562 [Moniliophthora roreri MCA 2997]